MIYLSLFIINLKNQIQKPGPTVMVFTFSMLNTMSLFFIWTLIFDKVPKIGNVSINDMSFLFGMATSVVGLSGFLFGGVFHLPFLISSRQFERFMQLPRGVLQQIFPQANYISQLGVAICSIFFFLKSNLIHPSNLHVLALYIANGTLIYVGFLLWTGSLTFYHTSLETVSSYSEQFMMTFLLFPEKWFGPKLRFVLYSLFPIGFISYIPLKTIDQFYSMELLVTTLGSIVFYALCVSFFNFSLKRYGKK